MVDFNCKNGYVRMSHVQLKSSTCYVLSKACKRSCCKERIWLKLRTVKIGDIDVHVHCPALYTALMIIICD